MRKASTVRLLEKWLVDMPSELLDGATTLKTDLYIGSAKTNGVFIGANSATSTSKLVLFILTLGLYLANQIWRHHLSICNLI